MFERMEIAEKYEDVVEPSYKRFTRADSICAGHSMQMRGEATLSKITPR